MQSLDPIVTAHPLTGALRTVSANLLRDVYLAPAPRKFDLAEAMTGRDAPWSGSFSVAPTETGAAIAEGLRALAMATRRLTPDEMDLSQLDPASRVHSHVAALTALWRDHPEALPEDLQTLRHVLACKPGDALEPLPVIEAGDPDFASPVETALREVLIAHHGSAPEAAAREWRSRQAPLRQGAPEGSSLANVQRGLLESSVTPQPLDRTVSFHGLRDLAEEADFAAARAQRLIERGAEPSEIAVLTPDETAYHLHLAQAFGALGLPLSGLPPAPAQRDVAAETLLHFLLCLHAPAPAMALASLYTSPLMPWPAETGAALARETMQGRFEPYVARGLTGRAGRLFAALRQDAPESADGVARMLDLLVQCMTEDETRHEMIEALHLRIAWIRPMLTGAEPPDWTRLFRAVTPRPEPAPERFVDGVSVFPEAALPWRPARHMIVLGMAGGRWPRPAPVSSLFLDSELQHLRERTGLHIPTRADRLAGRLELLRRQLLAATETLTILSPVRSPDGGRQPPAAALSLIARTIRDEGKGEIAGVEDAETLVHDLRALPAERWSCAHRVVLPLPNGGAPVPPPDGAISLDRNLLEARRAGDGAALPQTPSRMETLLVSPLAWALAEFGAEAMVWEPEGLDILLAGTLAHDVFEHLFPANAPLPTPDIIEARTPELLAQAIRRHAPFLQGAIWAVERQGLQREVLLAAKAWGETLAAHGVQVIGNETDLRGEALGLRMRGRADCLLRLPGNRLLIVDHKKSGTPARRRRMEAGWDLQLGLYREMLANREGDGGMLDQHLSGRPQVGVAYHLMNDQGVLAHGLTLEPGAISVLDGDISGEAIAWLSERIAEVREGSVRLNTTEDAGFFKKTAKLTPYARDASPLIVAFMVERGAGDD